MAYLCVGIGLSVGQSTLSNKAQIYGGFKNDHCLETYLIILPQHEYISLFKFRTANHRFPIESGRWDGTALEDRPCTLCNKRQIGSEKHYLLECEYFTNARNTCLNNISDFKHGL